VYLDLPLEITAKKVNKKVKRLARKSALSIKAKQKSIVVLEDIQWDAPKTKNYLQMLAALGLADKKSVLVLADLNKNVYLSSRNLKNSKVVINSELNTYNFQTLTVWFFVRVLLQDLNQF